MFYGINRETFMKENIVSSEPLPPHRSQARQGYLRNEETNPPPKERTPHREERKPQMLRNFRPQKLAITRPER